MMAMYRKPAPPKSLDKRLGLLGMLSFMLAALAVIPIIVGVLYAVAYMPFGVAFLVLIGYMTRRRWTPGLRRRAQEFLSEPEIFHGVSRGLRERTEQLRPAPVRVRVETDAEILAKISADLRNLR